MIPKEKLYAIDASVLGRAYMFRYNATLERVIRPCIQSGTLRYNLGTLINGPIPPLIEAEA